MEINISTICLAVILFTFALTCVSEAALIPFLRRNAKQPIYTDGPSWHSAKQGTPTMGGLAFAAAVSVAVLLCGIYLYKSGDSYPGISLMICLSYCLFNSLVGFLDDITKLKRKSNGGLTPIQKLLLQTFFAVIFLFLRQRLLNCGTSVDLPGISVDLGIWYYPLACIMLVGIVNFANLTDGIDGLAASVALAIGTAFLFISANSPDTAILAAATMGSALAFLPFNLNPARIFMGDTGSLFFGALTVCCAFTLDNPLLILPIGAVYIAEGASVVLQVIGYKLTGKRLFKMAPLHHHLEKSGLEESKICVIAVAATLTSSVVLSLFI